MKPQIKIKYLIVIVVIFCCYYLFQRLRLVEISIKKTLIDKAVSSDKYGNAYYNLKWRMEDGSYETEKSAFSRTPNYEIGNTYIINKQKIKFE